MTSLTQLVGDAMAQASVESLNLAITPIRDSVTLSFEVPMGNKTVIPYAIYGVEPGKKYAVWAELTENIRGVMLWSEIKTDGLLYLTVANYSGAVVPASAQVDFVIAQAF